jgi:hypothetical protein
MWNWQLVLLAQAFHTVSKTFQAVEKVVVGPLSAQDRAEIPGNKTTTLQKQGF